MPNYQDLSTDELLHIALEREQLTDEARFDLDGELTRRKISANELNAYKADCAQADEEDRVRSANRVVRPGFLSRRDFGFRFLGKMNCHRDPSGQFEEYESTQWFVVFWIPVFPIATFKVRRNLSRWLGIDWRSDPEAIERYPRNWNQILLTWVKAMAFLLVLRIAYLWLTRS